MGYHRAEPDTFGRYLNYFRVPGGETIPNKRTVRRRMRQGEDPTLLSFEKWDRIAEVASELDKTPNPGRYYADLRGYLSAESCALCIDSIERLRRERGEYKYREEKCEVCPLAEIEACTKRGSVFDRIDDILAYAFDPKTPPDQARSNHERLLQLVATMRNNLRGLLPEQDGGKTRGSP